MTIQNIKDTTKDVLVSDKELVIKLFDLAEGIIEIAHSLRQRLESQPKLYNDEETIDDLHKLAMEEDIPDWVMCGGSD